MNQTHTVVRSSGAGMYPCNMGRCASLLYHAATELGSSPPLPLLQLALATLHCATPQHTHVHSIHIHLSQPVLSSVVTTTTTQPAHSSQLTPDILIDLQLSRDSSCKATREQLPEATLSKLGILLHSALITQCLIRQKCMHAETGPVCIGLSRDWVLTPSGAYISKTAQSSHARDHAGHTRR